MTWTAKQVNIRLEKNTAGDAHVERGYKEDFIADRNLYPDFKSWSKASAKAWGYRCYDKYRPGYFAWGKTPKDAANNAGFWIH